MFHVPPWGNSGPDMHEQVRNVAAWGSTISVWTRTTERYSKTACRFGF